MPGSTSDGGKRDSPLDNLEVIDNKVFIVWTIKATASVAWVGRRRLLHEEAKPQPEAWTLALLLAP